MVKYAILGATGNCGGAVLDVLSRHQDVAINVFVRSREKLLKLSGDACRTASVQIFEGGLDDADTLLHCIRGTSAMFLTIAAAKSQPGVRVAQDTAAAVISILERLRAEDTSVKLPFLIVLSSAEADDNLYYLTPWPIRSILYAANYFVYQDLIAMETYLRGKEWVQSVFVKPGGISHDTQAGHILSETEIQTFVSWLDVAAGMVQLADEGGDPWASKSVSVCSKAKAKVEWSNGLLLFTGLGVYVRSCLPF